MRLFLAFLAWAALVTAMPINSGPYEFTIGEVVDISHSTADILLDQTGCVGQSCDVADLSGSSGRPPTKKPE
jgi:hypothetical protein